MLKAPHRPGTESLFMVIKGDSPDASDPTDIVLLSIIIQYPERDDEDCDPTLIPGSISMLLPVPSKSYVIDESYPRPERDITV